MRLYEVESPRMWGVVDEDEVLEELAGGLQFTEGPIWDEATGRLVFSDIPANTLYGYSDGAGLSVLRSPSGHPNGNAIAPDGSLLTCEHSGRRVVRTAPDGTVEVLASEYHGKRLNSPNDVIVRSDGLVLFTDPNYGITPEGFGVVDVQELPYQGVYSVQGGEVTLLLDDFSGPNGLALSPDESVLYVDDTDRFHIRSFSLHPDGSLTNRGVLASLTGDGPGAVDGMLVDSAGDVLCTGPGGIYVVTAEGEQLGRILMPAQTANLTWAGDGESIFLTASSTLYRLRVRARPPSPLRRSSSHGPY